MKRTRTNAPDGLRRAYDFDYREARPNRFAGRVDQERKIVALDVDVSRVFTSSEAVNTVLRALIQSMPRPASSELK